MGANVTAQWVGSGEGQQAGPGGERRRDALVELVGRDEVQKFVVIEHRDPEAA